LTALKAHFLTLAHFRHFKLQTFSLQLTWASCPDKNTSSNLWIEALSAFVADIFGSGLSGLGENRI
jgi:hypothetical protein